MAETKDARKRSKTKEWHEPLKGQSSQSEDPDVRAAVHFIKKSKTGDKKVNPKSKHVSYDKSDTSHYKDVAKFVSKEIIEKKPKKSKGTVGKRYKRK